MEMEEKLPELKRIHSDRNRMEESLVDRMNFSHLSGIERDDDYENIILDGMPSYLSRNQEGEQEWSNTVVQNFKDTNLIDSMKCQIKHIVGNFISIYDNLPKFVWRVMIILVLGQWNIYENNQQIIQHFVQEICPNSKHIVTELSLKALDTIIHSIVELY